MYKFLTENLACVWKLENHSLNMDYTDHSLEGLTEFLINSHWLKNVLDKKITLVHVLIVFPSEKSVVPIS